MICNFFEDIHTTRKRRRTNSMDTMEVSELEIFWMMGKGKTFFGKNQQICTATNHKTLGELS